MGLGTATHKFIAEDGDLTREFRAELKTVAKQELELLEKNVNTKRPASEDIFGVKRSFC